MKVQIQANKTGEEILKDFSEELKKNKVEVSWKEGSLTPIGVKIIVINKNGQEIELAPDKLKIVFNSE